MNIDKTLPTSGERLRRARILAGLATRREFEKKYNISANTLQGWEQGKNPLSEKGARRVVEAFKWEGLLCSVEWLMHGTGMPPRPYDILNAGLKEPFKKDEVLTEQNIREEETIYKETQLFKEQNVNSIILSSRVVSGYVREFREKNSMALIANDTVSIIEKYIGNRLFEIAHKEESEESVTSNSNVCKF